MKLEELKKDAVVNGIVPNRVVRVVATSPAGPDAVTVYYKTDDGQILERMVFRNEEATLSLAEAGRPWAFDAPGEEFKLAAEAWRINLAHLFDPLMAVHTSNVEPLPHQITAVYESMLPRQPLRYVLADDPGAGKTIMAGLYIRELIMRADAYRILIVAPGSLVGQWQDELSEKFGLDFTMITRDHVETSRSGNPFDDHNQVIARLDQLSRNPLLQEKLAATRWDLVVFDEAHKLSATYTGGEIKKTGRFQLCEAIGATTRHLLLMTATPHNGKEDDFHLFLSLLDSDRFYGKPRDGARKVDVSDMMRRMVKEDLLKFDGSRLFPERLAYTANYQLSDAEAALYHAVTDYVKREWMKVDQLEDGRRRGSVGFALTSLQRRLASSPEAIYQSIKRRRARLVGQLEDAKLQVRGALLAPKLPAIPDDLDDLDGDEEESLEEQVTCEATAATNIAELEYEIEILRELEEQARLVVASGTDRKWDELSRILQDTPEMRDGEGRQRKLIIFTEHRDTLNYLHERIGGLIGNRAAVVTIHGQVRREDRRKIQDLFRNDPEVRVLVATDAAGEGVNLQNANLMVNYDLPWNPNRLEQRFGRIHRIGQTQVCHLWNLVAAETREGDVFRRLFDKLEEERKALGGRVFDILGAVFDERSLRDLLIDALRYGEDPARQEELGRKVEGALDRDKIEAVIKANALCEDVLDAQRLLAVKDEMDRAEARKLQPFFVRAFFEQMLKRLGGELRLCEPGRWKIPHVPSIVQQRDRQIAGRDRRNLEHVTPRYERVCFEKQYVRVQGKPSAPMATLLHPGHPLVATVTDLALEQFRGRLKQGAVMVAPHDDGLTPRVDFAIEHSVRESRPPQHVMSRRLQFTSIDAEGGVSNAGWAPHLDLEPLEGDDLALVQDVLAAPWITGDLEARALVQAAQDLVPKHFDEFRERRELMVTRTLAAVHERLTTQLRFWEDRFLKLRDDRDAGKDVRLNLDNVRRTIEDLTARLQTRSQELESMRHVFSATPVAVGGVLVIPGGLLRQRRGDTVSSTDVDPAARARVERVAMDAVMDAERRRGHTVRDVSAEKCGWDVTSLPPVGADGVLLPARHIEVKGRARGEKTICVTRNEIMYALNQGDKFWLAIVLVDGDAHEGPYYVRTPFTREPDWGTVSVNYELDALLQRAEPVSSDSTTANHTVGVQS